MTLVMMTRRNVASMERCLSNEKLGSIRDFSYDSLLLSIFFVFMNRNQQTSQTISVEFQNMKLVSVVLQKLHLHKQTQVHGATLVLQIQTVSLPTSVLPVQVVLGDQIGKVCHVLAILIVPMVTVILVKTFARIVQMMQNVEMEIIALQDNQYHFVSLVVSITFFNFHWNIGFRSKG